MIPIIQFDPASLSLWYDANLIGSSRGSREIGLALEYAIVGDDQALQDLISCIDDEWVQTRAANLASTVWHEKRHFLDFILTNYGALRIRTFLEMYFNIGTILNAKQSTSRLLVPLDSNLDSLTCDLFDIQFDDPELIKLAESVESRKRILMEDRRPIVSRFGTIEMGGEALMESIAYHVQTGKLHRVFGGDMNRRVQSDHPNNEVHELKYKWAYELLIRTNLLKIDAASEGEILLDDAPIFPLFYGALAGRFWGQEQASSETSSSYLPGERLASLAISISSEYPDFASASVIEAWDIVNTTCEALFDRTAIEETYTDYQCESGFLELVGNINPDSHLVKAFSDLHELRGRLISTLETEPGLILDQALWADELVNRTHPSVVVTAPSGVIGVPPDGFNRISGYQHDYGDQVSEKDYAPEATWWWAAMNQQWPLDNDDTSICLREKESWSYIASEYAPLAKLFYSGHKIRVMLGPELLAVRLRFQAATGVKLILDPLFMYPKSSHDIAYWYFITGKSSFRCSLSSETVDCPEGYMLDPWELRLRPGLREAILGSTVESHAMALTFWRDWTPWIVSEEFKDYFESFEADEQSLYAGLHEL